MSEEIFETLHLLLGKLSPDQLIEFAARNIDGVDQFGFIRTFKQAFPKVPLRVLIEANTSRHLVGEGGLDEKTINELLSPWLKTSGDK